MDTAALCSGPPSCPQPGGASAGAAIAASPSRKAAADAVAAVDLCPACSHEEVQLCSGHSSPTAVAKQPKASADLLAAKGFSGLTPSPPPGEAGATVVLDVNALLPDRLREERKLQLQ